MNVNLTRSHGWRRSMRYMEEVQGWMGEIRWWMEQVQGWMKEVRGWMKKVQRMNGEDPWGEWRRSRGEWKRVIGGGSMGERRSSKRWMEKIQEKKWMAFGTISHQKSHLCSHSKRDVSTLQSPQINILYFTNFPIAETWRCIGSDFCSNGKQASQCWAPLVYYML